MSYQVLARKWRPQTFSELVGQKHITDTLKNSILRQRVGHAYMFVGTRGIGKTTLARIFAKALNCDQPVDGANPCCKCVSCTEITIGSCLDVIEIDGASNNSVEDIRKLRENVNYSPSRCQYKIYIIDEVHMLTTAAWNALLKTLEEPPAHVKFLFATTEAHKVLPTILSRCQRFDLKTLSQSIITGHLKTVTKAENILISQEALAAIARAAKGGMRDALSITDQLISFSTQGQEISEVDVTDVFGLTSYSDLAEITQAMFANSAKSLVESLNKQAEKGRNIEVLFEDLMSFLRSLMVIKLTPSEAEKILALDDSIFKICQNLVSDVDSEVLQNIVTGFLDFSGQIRYSHDKRIFVEVILIKIMKSGHAVQIDLILAKLKELRDTPSLSDQSEKKKNNLISKPLESADSAKNVDSQTVDSTTKTIQPVKPIREEIISKKPVDSAKNYEPEYEREEISKSIEIAEETLSSDNVYQDIVNNSIAASEKKKRLDVNQFTEELASDLLTPQNASVVNKVSHVETETSLKVEPPIVEKKIEKPIADSAKKILIESEDSAKINIDSNSSKIDETPVLELWNLAIEKMKSVEKYAYLTATMIEIKPLKYEKNILELGINQAFDEEKKANMKNFRFIKILTACLVSVAENKHLEIQMKDIADSAQPKASPKLTASKEIWETVNVNQFVKETKEFFDGEIIDVRG